MDVIAYAGAILGGIVGPEDMDRFSASRGCLQDQRNQMRFRIVGLAQIFRRAGRVEITKAAIPEPVNAVQPCEHLLHQQLGFAINVGGPKRLVFRDGHPLRVAVEGRRG